MCDSPSVLLEPTFDVGWIHSSLSCLDVRGLECVKWGSIWACCTCRYAIRQHQGNNVAVRIVTVYYTGIDRHVVGRQDLVLEALLCKLLVPNLYA